MKNIIFLTFLALLTGCESVKNAIDDHRRVAKLGVIASSEITWITEAKTFERVMSYYRDQNVDAVVIAGGATKNGYKNQYEVLNKVYTKVFATKKTPLIITEGEHEVNGFKFRVSFTHPYENQSIPTFFGEGKTPLTDESTVYPIENNAFYAGSLSGLKLASGYEYLGKLPNVAQGLLVSAYEDETIIRRLDFSGKTPVDVAKPWRYPADKLDLKNLPAPDFPEDSYLQVIPGYIGADSVYTLRFASVRSAFAASRAYSYEMTAAFADNPKAPFLRRTLLSSGFYTSEANDTLPLSVIIKKDELPEGKLIFSVTPISSMGKRGRSISAQL